MRRQAVAAVLLSLLFAAVGWGQVVYEPARSQYRTAGGDTVHYGGRDPRVVEYVADRLAAPRRAAWDLPVGRYGFELTRRGLIGEPPQYTVADRAPYRNGYPLGYSSVDARNDAAANVPRFFRTADLLAAAGPAADGVGVVVPAQAPGTIDVRAGGRTVPAAGEAGTRPAPRPVLIIPKRELERPAAPARVVAAAR